MPPKAKKTPTSSQKRSGGRLRKAVEVKPEEENKEEINNIHEVEDINNIEDGDDVKTSDLDLADEAVAVVSNGSADPLNKEDEVKEDEFEKDERLDLEDNEPEYEPEYEPEEYGGDYDDKEGDQEDLQEEGDEVVEEAVEEAEEEGDLVEEEEGDMVEDELEEDPEEIEGEEDDEHADAGEGGEHDQGHEDVHTDMIDAAEEQEHHDLVKERRKRKEFEVFVGGLDKDATENDLKEVFSVVGEVTEVRLMMNPQTKKNKGFAFLRFATVEQAKRAVTELRNPVVRGKQCGVTPSQDSDTLFLGNICKIWTKEKLKEKLKLYGIDNIEDLTLVEDTNSDGKNRGFAFLEFASRSEAMDAFKRLQKKDVLLGVDRPAKVSFADSFIDPGDEIMAQVKTVFIDGLPSSWDEDRVRELLKKFGDIEKVELARNMPSARRKDFGFVTFDSHDAAVTCAKSINNAELGEGDHKAKVRARLSRPLQRGKGKNHPHGDHKNGRRRRLRAPWNRPLPPPRPSRTREIGGRVPADRGGKRPVRRPPPPMPARARPLPPPPRSYERRAPAPPPKSSLRRDYPRRDALPPRSRAAVDYSSRLPPERRPSYRDEYAARAPVYSDVHRSSTSRSAVRRPYDDNYAPRYERPPPSYRDSRSRDYDSISGSKRPYSAVDDVPSRYADPGRHSRARLDYDMPARASQYEDAYGDRLGRSSAGFSSSGRSSMSAQDSHGLYSSSRGMGYSGSYSSSDVGAGGAYPSYGGDYASRGSDVGGSSYSSLYPSRSVSGSGYMGGGGSSGSYY